MRRLDVLACVFVALIGGPAVSAGQWLRYPTEGMPRKPDGKPDLTAPAPRLPDGHPDLSGLWHAAQPRQCANAAGESIPCGIEIGGSPLGGNLGRNLPGGTLPYQPWAAKLFQERHAALSIDDPHVRCLPGQPAAVVDTAASHESGAHAEAAGAALRSERDVPADLHRRPAAAERSESRVERLLDRALGRRHARRRRPKGSATTSGSTPGAAR